LSTQGDTIGDKVLETISTTTHTPREGTFVVPYVGSYNT